MARTHSEHKDKLRMLYYFLTDIGAEPDGEKNEIENYMQRFYDHVVTNNPIFPKAKESEVLAAWTKDVINGVADRRGNNISAMVICFNNWIKTRSDFAPKPVYRTEEQAGPLESWSNEILLNQIRIVRQLGNGGIKWLHSIKGARGYLERIMAELDKRGIKYD